MGEQQREEQKRIRKIGIKAANAAMGRGSTVKAARIVAREAEHEARKEGR